MMIIRILLFVLQTCHHTINNIDFYFCVIDNKHGTLVPVIGIILNKINVDYRIQMLYRRIEDDDNKISLLFLNIISIRRICSSYHD